MKKLLTLFLIIGSVSLYAQENSVANDSLKWTKGTCEKGTQQAELDFNKGLYVCNSYGLVFQTESSEFINFLQDYRKLKYGIVTKNAGCVVTDYSECYASTMRTLVYQKFGSDIFERSKKEAKELYSKNK